MASVSNSLEYQYPSLIGNTQSCSTSLSTPINKISAIGKACLDASNLKTHPSPPKHYKQPPSIFDQANFDDRYEASSYIFDSHGYDPNDFLTENGDGCLCKVSSGLIYTYGNDEGNIKKDKIQRKTDCWEFSNGDKISPNTYMNLVNYIKANVGRFLTPANVPQIDLAISR